MKPDDRTPSAPAPTPANPASSAGPRDFEPAPGSQVGEYVLLGPIAAGGAGTVYAAEHRVLGRPAAVKVLHRELASSAEMVERFLREARIVNRIRHPNIVDIHDFGELPDGRPYYVMDLLPGVSLRKLIQQRGRISPEETLGLIEPICAALAAAHEAGIVHRDLKASNVAVLREGDPPEVKLLDFGVAKLLRDGGRGLTAVGQRLGTPHAMAPEQIRGSGVGPQADIYALGVLLYQMVTGRYPFQAEDPLELEQLHLKVPAPRPSLLAPVSPAVDAVVLRCLEKDPAQRFQSVGAVVEALRAAVGRPAPGSAAPAARVRGEAVGIYVEVRLPDGGEEDDELLAALGAVLDRTEQALRAGGFQLYLQTAGALLAVRALGDSSRELRRGAVALVRSLLATPSGDGRIAVSFQVHAAAADLRSGPDGVQVEGGPIVQLQGWPPEGTGPLQISAAAADGL